MKIYERLTPGQKYWISRLKKIGQSPMEIAEELDVHKYKINLELDRNTGERGFRPKQADEKTAKDE